jgi:hypothetical protein
MESRSMRKARRSAGAINGGVRILNLILSPGIRHKLVAAAEAGSPPVSAISKELLALLGRQAKLSPVKQYAGVCIRAVLEEEGYELAEKGVHIGRDPVFRTGSTYRRAAAVVAGSDPFWPRFVGALSEEEAEQLMKALLSRKRRR